MNLLVAYNGSQPSKKAVELSKKYAKVFNAAVTILVSMQSDINEGSSKDKAERFWADVKEIEADLNRLQTEFKKASINCSTQIAAKGVDPATDILDYAQKICADGILIGIEKKSRVGKLLFGSTAQKVILEADCPVFTIGT